MPATTPPDAASPPRPPRRAAHTPLAPAHLLSLRGLPAGPLRALLTRARELGRRPEPSLTGRTVATLFFEDSTRTKTSFTLAAQRLGAVAIDLAVKTSSVTKGETVLDTARTVEAMGIDALVVRAAHSGLPALIAQHTRCPVLNAGDGRHEHPTQALADALALDEAFARAENTEYRPGSFDFAHRRVVIVGDIVSSRVARSNIAALTALGARVVCIGPPAMAPAALATLGCEVAHDLDAHLPHADAVMMLRIQFERGAGALIASPREFRSGYALTAARMAAMRPGAAVMHPGPMNRGVEIDDAVADSPRSIILRQVFFGVAARMAALERSILPRPHAPAILGP